MEITEVKVYLKSPPDKKLKAYVTLTFDNMFVVKDVKIIEGSKGLFIAMPSRRIRRACIKCSSKNDLRARYCNQCGIALPVPEESSSPATAGGISLDQRDIAHPITQSFRDHLQKKVIEVFEQERVKGNSRQAYPEDLE